MASNVEVAVIGAGNAGIAAAYYLFKHHGVTDIVIIDPLVPMSLTSAQSGENYRNWWPHPVMRAFCDHSISLMEEIARQSNNRIQMTRRGYALATRAKQSTELIDDLYASYGRDDKLIRIHTAKSTPNYTKLDTAKWEETPLGVDVLLSSALIQQTFPSFSPEISSVLHIRRAGAISGQQLGQFMLDAMRPKVRVIQAKVTGIDGANPFKVRLSDGSAITSKILINAAGPYVSKIGTMLGEELPVKNIYQQKIAFDDTLKAIPRDMPFSIDLDRTSIPWTDEERAVLASDPAMAPMLRELPGGIHCKPEGAEHGTWIKLGWAFNATPGDPDNPAPNDPTFPDVVVRTAAKLNPSLAGYVGRLPRSMRHYGGYYTMTSENLPLIGPTDIKNYFVNGALSGFGTMSCCAAGALCAAWVADVAKPDYAESLAPGRYQNKELMHALTASGKLGIL